MIPIINLDENNNKKLLACRVNREWEEITKEIEDMVDNPYLVGDGERATKAYLPALHEPCCSMCGLWKDSVDKEERRIIVSSFASILFKEFLSILMIKRL